NRRCDDYLRRRLINATAPFGATDACPVFAVAHNIRHIPKRVWGRWPSRRSRSDLRTVPEEPSAFATADGHGDVDEAGAGGGSRSGRADQGHEALGSRQNP